MKQLEKDFQFFDYQLEKGDKGLFSQVKDSPFAQFGQNLFANLNSDEFTKEVLKQSGMKDVVDNAKGRKTKPEGKEMLVDEKGHQIGGFPSLDQEPQLDNHDRKLFVEMLYPDIHFQVDQQLIPAHRYILLTRCPAFGRMFTSGMIESKTSVIQLNDVRPATFQAFLEFIYCGDVTISDFEVALELLNEADKYFLAELKKKIGRYLKSQINLENVIEIANLSELHEVDPCRDTALKFILSNFDALFENKHKLTDLIDPCLIQLFKKYRRNHN